MKVIRISHFTTKGIDVKKISRPKPTIDQPLEQVKITKTSRGIRHRLSVKLNLKEVTATYRTPIKPLKKKGIPKNQKKLGKIERERQVLNAEASYAAKPQASKSSFLEKVIQREAAFFRELYQNGRIEMEDENPSSGGSNQESWERLLQA